MRLAALSILCAVVAGTASAGSNPVLVELFTSEGCSSCPSADRVLSDLRENENVAVLGWHVDYWDYLGWEDRFAQDEATPRQRAYAAALARGRMYTPQMVVNGAAEFVGSDRLRAKRAVEDAHEAKRMPIALEVKRDGDRLAIGVRAEKPETSSLLVAITEDGLASAATRGENAGRTLHHDGVVREVMEVGESGKVEAEIAKEWNGERLNVVAWIQDAKTLAVLGVAQVRVK